MKGSLIGIYNLNYTYLLSVQGQTRLSSKGKLPYPLPISPKNESELYFSGFSTSKVILYLHLNPLNFLYFQGFFSPYPEIQNDLIERIFPLYKVVLLLLILFLGLPQIAFAGYSGVPRDMEN